ncbi:YjcZ family sporulation protein [Bacillus megaterium]|nr:YjcZ family sporulation protein [Priestia megaterium]
MLGYGGYGRGGSNKGFVLLIVLFILLVIIGTRLWRLVIIQ